MIKQNEQYKNVILDFRKKVQIAKNHGLRKSEIQDQSGLNYGTMISLMETDIEKIKIRTSTLVKMQDYIKYIVQHYPNDPSSASANEKPLSEKELEKEMEEMGLVEEKSGKDYLADNTFKDPKPFPPLEEPKMKDIAKQIPDEPESLKDKTVGDPLTEKELEFFRKLGEAHKIKPDNCVITVNLY